MKRTDFTYHLPPELIAQHPLPERTASRLLYLNGATGKVSHHHFTDLLDFLRADDLLVFAPSLLNRYGHVAIIASVGSDTLEIAQQNPGPFASARESIPFAQREGRWYIQHDRVRGWLRLPAADEQNPTLDQSVGLIQ